MLRREEQYKHQIKEIKVMIKKIGIIGAMEEEVEALRGKLTYVRRPAVRLWIFMQERWAIKKW